MMASGSQYLEENDNGSPKATRNGKGGHLPRSQESKIWDLDGDGVLNDAELALKNMAAGNGEIDKQEIYKLMQEHISVQRSLWKFKRIAAAFFVLIVILGIANVGTSFAAAIIAKDTTASGGNLKEKGDGGKTLGTQTFADQTEAFVEPIDAKGVCSKLEGTCSGFYKCCPGLVCNADTEECENDPNRTITSVLEINVEQGKAMVEDCKLGRTVFLDRKFTHGTDMQLAICPPIGGHKAIYDNKALSSLQIETPRGIVIIAPNDEGTYYTATGEGVTSDKNFPCDETIDCDFGLVCHLEEMAYDGLTTEYVNKCVEFYATVGTGMSISPDPTISWTRPPRPSPDDVATVIEATTPAPSPAASSAGTFIGTTVLGGGSRNLREV
mmetsp:Transcript_17127/g.26076  ORF Transcript_17127/g.26076 Transcript_17127/m.26076 type:complete len:383 (-) Transcript_17127:281-1429(-)